MKEKRHTMRAAVYLLLVRGNEILLTRRYNTGYQDGKYSLIAGHLDGDETATSAMVREAKEEAGIVVQPENLQFAHVMHRMSNVEYIDFFFVASRWQGEPYITEPDKCDDMQWYTLDNLPSNLLPYVKKAIENYKKKIYFSEENWNT
jgi:mutator protein MutT